MEQPEIFPFSLPYRHTCRGLLPFQNGQVRACLVIARGGSGTVAPLHSWASHYWNQVFLSHFDSWWQFFWLRHMLILQNHNQEQSSRFQLMPTLAQVSKVQTASKSGLPCHFLSGRTVFPGSTVCPPTSSKPLSHTAEQNWLAPI